MTGATRNGTARKFVRAAAVCAVLLVIFALMVAPASAKGQGSGHHRGGCFGAPVTLRGTSGDDTMTGTSGNDSIWAQGGDDIVNGNGGNDSVCAGGGANTVVTGAGDDWVIVNAGTNTVNTGLGLDHVFTTGGTATINGTAYVGAQVLTFVDGVQQ